MTVAERKVARAAQRAVRARQSLELANREAHGAGIPLRAIAAVAGMSHETVRRIASPYADLFVEASDGSPSETTRPSRAEAINGFNTTT